MSLSLIRDSAENINAIEKKDGQILIETDKGEDNKVYYDNGTDRCTYGGYLGVDDEMNTMKETALQNRVATVAISTLKNRATAVYNSVRSDKDDINDFNYDISHAKILWQRRANTEGTPDYKGVITDTYELSEKISEQNLGIIIVFSAMNKSVNTSTKPVYSPQKWYFSSKFIPKDYINKHKGRGYSFQLFGSNEFTWRVGLKYMYIYDDKIVENAGDFESPSNKGGEWVPVTGSNGISYATDLYCVRYILGV